MTTAPSPQRSDLPTGTVTFLFTDIEGSTRLSETVGDGFAALIDRHHAILRSAIAAEEGTVVSTEGDAFFAVFTDPARAVLAVAAAQRDLDAEPWPPEQAVRVRMGLHTGLGRLGGDDYAGVDVNRAARVADAAHGGQVLLSEATAAEVAPGLPEGLALRGLGAIRLRGLDRSEVVLQLDIAGLQAEFPPLRAERPGSLPESLTTFLGRDGEIKAVVGLVGSHRLVTLTGPGGTGKTRLSIEVARRLQSRFDGGAWFVPLESLHDRSLVLPAIAERLGTTSSPGQSTTEAIADTIAERDTLLVLDNLEQVIEAAPDIAHLLETVAHLYVIASSREALRVAGEQEFPVPVLDEALAVDLFVERARQVRPDFAPDAEERRRLLALVARLDRLPLAIELAAARARRFSVAVLHERVTADLAGLDSGRRDAVDRQRTLRGAVAWSYELLDEAERHAFDRLAVFAGGADLGVLEDVLGHGQGEDVPGLVESLADKSLLAIESGPGGMPRARMLETIHAFAEERLALDPERDAVVERHAQRYLEFCEAIEPELSGERSDEAFARMETEHDNVRRALEWSLQHRPAVGLRIGGAIWRFWQQRGHLAEGQQRLGALVAAAATIETDPYALGRGCTGLGGMHYWQGEYDEARRVYEDALAQYRACGDRRSEAAALYDLSYPVAFDGDADAAVALQEESLHIYEEIGDDAGAALVREGRAVLAMMAGDHERARELQQDVVAASRVGGGLFRLNDNLGLLAMLESLLGHHPEARSLLEEMRAIHRRLRDRSGLAGGLQIAGLVANGEGDYETTALGAGAIQGMRDEGARMLVPSDTLDFPDPAVEARAQLGERYDELFEAGRAMDPEEVFLGEYSASSARSNASGG